MTPGDRPANDALTQVRSAVATVLECEDVTAGGSLADDLGADSLDLFCIRMELEEHLSIVITDESFAAVRTVGDLAALVDRLTARGRRDAL